MKTKNILGLVAIVAVAVAMAFNVTVSNKKNDTASLLAMNNMEALADGENPQINAKYTIQLTVVVCTKIIRGDDGQIRIITWEENQITCPPGGGFCTPSIPC